MSAQIERDFDFQAGVYFQETYLMNVYSFNLSMDVNTDSIREQNVAMDRIKYMIYEVFENTVFINETEKKVIEKYNDAGLKTCTLPEDPYDQIIALLLMLKLNAVCENRLKINGVTLTSKLSDDVKFKETIETAIHTYSHDGWWNESNPELTYTVKTKSKKDKVVKLVNNEWNDIGLSWKEKRESPKEIIFTTEFDK